MGKNEVFKSVAKSAIDASMNAQGSVSIDEILDASEGLYEFDIQKLVRRAARTDIRSMLAARKDVDGVRTTFAMKNSGLFVDIDRCEDKKSVEAIQEQLFEREMGIHRSRHKAERRVREIDGQINLFEENQA